VEKHTEKREHLRRSEQDPEASRRARDARARAVFPPPSPRSPGPSGAEATGKAGFLRSSHPIDAGRPGTESLEDDMTANVDTAPRNGVDTATLFATLDAVRAQPDIAKFQFRASNTWVSGTHSRSTLSGFYGAGQEMEHQQVTELDSDHPAVLVGRDNGPTPVEYLLHAIASCLTAGVANIAAARKVTLTKVSSTVEGDIDLLGILGLSDGSVRNGYQQIRVTFHIEGDADEETLRGIVEQSRRRSAVYDALTNPTAVVIDVVTG
jgi:uncharacterized OsmC-like protein